MKTNISWADKSLNFYNWYCTKISAGCKNCYMFAMRKQFGREPQALQWRESAMKEYKQLNDGEVVFVNSMSDTYHEEADTEWIRRIHKLAYAKPGVKFLLLTKRPERALLLSDILLWPDNLWLGASVESKKYLERINILAKIPAKHKFLSVEPLLESLLPDLSGIVGLKYVDWMIVGGESGLDRRRFDKQWARELWDVCGERGIHFTFKQGANRLPGKDYELDGKYYLDTPFNDNNDTPAAPKPEQVGLFDGLHNDTE